MIAIGEMITLLTLAGALSFLSSTLGAQEMTRVGHLTIKGKPGGMTVNSIVNVLRRSGIQQP
jgi:hypothetical protein